MKNFLLELGQLENIEKIGEGGFSKIYKAFLKDKNEYVAFKV